LPAPEAKGGARARLVKIGLGDGNIEHLATNLSIEEATVEELKDLYSKRWGVKGVYDLLKNSLSLECFSGAKAALIKQDIYMSVFCATPPST